MKILVINGPNLNLLGVREPGIYGKSSFRDLLALLEVWAGELGVEVCQYQSNHEGDLVDKIQQALGQEILSYDLRIRYICPACREQENKSIVGERQER